MKVSVDPDLCEANAKCFIAAPEIFQPDDDGWAQVILEHLPEELHAKAVRAARLCPRLAIKVEEE
ncbi:MAG: ferredoxin [Dehalococcoidia bacterium]